MGYRTGQFVQSLYTLHEVISDLLHLLKPTAAEKKAFVGPPVLFGQKHLTDISLIPQEIVSTLKKEYNMSPFTC